MELRDYLQVIRLRKWVIIQAVVVVTLTAVVASLLQTPVYVGEASVLIQEKDTGAALLGSALAEFSSQPERGLQTQVELMRMRPLLEETIRTLALGVTPADLASDIEITAVGETNVVTIMARHEDPVTAASIANTLAAEFVAWSREYKRESIKAAAAEVESRLSEVEERILDLASEIEKEGASDEVEAELAIATGAYTTLAGQYEQLKINEQLEQGTAALVSPAVIAAEPVEPSPVRNAGLGLAVGLAFGLGMALLYEYLDNTVKSSDEAEQLVGAPVLGLVPAEKYEKDERRRASILTQPGSAAAEAYRVLRNNLDFINFQHDIKTLLITSAAPSEGKSTVAANLAIGLAQAGKKVVLLSCDFRKPTTEQFFGVSNLIGLSDVLTGQRSLGSAFQRPMGDLELLVLTSGKLPPNPSELLGSAKMKDLLDEAGLWADWVIIDSPPLLAVADGAAVARWTNGVLLVTKGGSSTRDAVKKAREMLANVGARVIGSVVWGLDTASVRSGHGYAYGKGTYGGYYSYADYYNTSAAEARRGPAHRAAAATGNVYVPAKSPGRRLAESLGRVMSVVLAVLAILVIATLVAYFVDRALGWGVFMSVWPSL